MLALRKPTGRPENLVITGAADAGATAPSVLRMQLLGANTAPKTMGLDELPGKVNYLIGNDSAKWRTNIPLMKRSNTKMFIVG